MKTVYCVFVQVSDGSEHFLHRIYSSQKLASDEVARFNSDPYHRLCQHEAYSVAVEVFDDV